MKLKKLKKLNNEELTTYSRKFLPLIQQAICELGLHLLSLTLTSENNTYYLRVTIIHPKKDISIDDCELVSRTVEKELDSLDSKEPIPFSYILEVQSPGIDKSLEKSGSYEFTLKNLGLVIQS